MTNPPGCSTIAGLAGVAGRRAPRAAPGLTSLTGAIQGRGRSSAVGCLPVLVLARPRATGAPPCQTGRGACRPRSSRGKPLPACPDFSARFTSTSELLPALRR